MFGSRTGGNLANRSITKSLSRNAALLGVSLSIFSLGSSAQTPSSCKGPEALETDAHANPSAGVYNALGASFAQSGEISCALTAFREAIRLDAN